MSAAPARKKLAARLYQEEAHARVRQVMGNVDSTDPHVQAMVKSLMAEAVQRVRQVWPD